jgi:hypothetical protein
MPPWIDEIRLAIGQEFNEGFFEVLLVHVGSGKATYLSMYGESVSSALKYMQTEGWRPEAGSGRTDAGADAGAVGRAIVLAIIIAAGVASVVSFAVAAALRLR